MVPVSPSYQPALAAVPTLQLPAAFKLHVAQNLEDDHHETAMCRLLLVAVLLFDRTRVGICTAERDPAGP